MPAGLDGAWAGAAIENGTPRLFELRFSRDARGALSTELTLPYNGYDRFPFSFAYRSGGPADGMLTGGLFGDRMDLVVDLSEGHLRGTVTTGDSVTMRVHLQKVVDVAAPAPSAEDVRFVAGTDTLAGTLLLPSGVVRPAVAVLVAGRGAESRTSMLGWGRLLTRFGVAAFAYDERGAGRSGGREATITSETRVEDVEAAVRLLAARADLGPVGLFGYSAAGWVMPRVAAADSAVAFVVMLVGPAEPLAEQQARTTVMFMQASGTPFSEADYAAAFEYQLQTVRLAQENAPWAAFERINAPARAARWAEHALIPDSIDTPDLDYVRRNRGFDAPPWARVRVPVLAIFGGSDPIVPPEPNATVLRRALAANADVSVHVLPGADHTLARPGASVGQGEWPARFYRPWTRSPHLFDLLREWFERRSGFGD